MFGWLNIIPWQRWQSGIYQNLCGLILSVMLLAIPALSYAADSRWDDPLDTQSAIPDHVMFNSCVDSVPPTPLSLADVVNIALCKNPQTASSWASVLGQAARLGSARSPYLPNVTATGTYGTSHSSGGTFDNTSHSTRFSPGISLDYLLFDFGSRAAGVAAAKQNLLAADYTHNATIQTVLYNVLQAYYQWFTDQAALDATRESVISAKAALDAATAKQAAGTVTKADMLQAQTQYQQALLNQITAENTFQQSQGKLANAMGLAPNIPFTLEAANFEALPDRMTQDVADLLAQAQKNRPDLAAALAQLNSAKANVAVQKAQGMPTVSLSAARNQDMRLSGNSYDGNSSSVNVSLSIPLFTGFDRDYQIAAAQADVAVQKAALRNTENNILLDVWQTYHNQQTAAEKLRATQSLLASADESARLALGRYQAGVGTITDLLVAQRDLADARQQQASARYNQMITQADLLRAVGQLDMNSISNK